MKIAVVNTKGGVGKTTTSIMLAAAIAASNETVEVWDADPQGSASLWAGLAEDDNEPLPYVVRGVNTVLIQRTKPTTSWVIIDTPPGNADIVQAAIDNVDLVVIPTLASGVDLQRVWPTLEASSHRLRAVLLTSAEPRTKAHQATVAVLAEANEPLFSTVIPKRQGVRALFGRRPENELFGYDALLEEIRKVA